MSVLDNIDANLDRQFENSAYLPQKLELEDFGLGLMGFLKDFNFSVMDENGKMKKVPVIHTMHELWAERKMNWKDMRNENGEEVSRPYISMYRTAVKRGTAPFRYTVPKHKPFKFVKVPVFDGTLKGFDIYKIPQPVYVDIFYEIRFVAHYTEDVDDFYEMMMYQAYSDGQGYLKINGYDVTSIIEEPSEENSIEDIASERVYQIIFPITVHGKLIDPTKFERVNTITKISIKISEK